MSSLSLSPSVSGGTKPAPAPCPGAPPQQQRRFLNKKKIKKIGSNIFQDWGCLFSIADNNWMTLYRDKFGCFPSGLPEPPFLAGAGAVFLVRLRLLLLFLLYCKYFIFIAMARARARGRNLSGARAGAGNFKNRRLRQPCFPSSNFSWHYQRIKNLIRG